MKNIIYNNQIIGTCFKVRYNYQLLEDTSNFTIQDVDKPTYVTVEKLTLINEETLGLLIGLIITNNTFKITIDNIEWNIKIVSIEDYSFGQEAKLITIKAKIYDIL
jgi:hypothetical protein